MASATMSSHVPDVSGRLFFAKPVADQLTKPSLNNQAVHHMRHAGPNTGALYSLVPVFSLAAWCLENLGRPTERF
jgi:hypothetical protein